MASGDERVDRSGGVHYNQFDRVRIENTWKIRLGKEKDHRAAAFDAGATGAFQMNLSNCCANSGFIGLKYSHNRMETVTEKEHKQSPQARTSMKGMDPNSIEVIAIKHLDRKPTEKWDVPVTSAQETGWLIANPVRADSLLVPNYPAQSSPSRSAAVGGGLRQRTAPPVAVPAMSLTTPANDRVLGRMQSAPSMPHSEPIPELRELNNRKWYRPKGRCDVTNYAEAYVSMNHCSPFSAQGNR
mmetsp:Transcript_59247/g.170157  ORF Transcript_59247/g.170157 Transcript_59247/m.170157 type:complete len:242 (-) Transcript_59247:65-790(-)